MMTGARIKIRRKELGMSAKSLAAECGLSPATIYRYEKGDIENMGIDKLKPIAAALMTTPAYLIGWDDSKSALSSSGMNIQDIAEEMNIPIGRAEEVSLLDKRHYGGDDPGVMLDQKGEYGTNNSTEQRIKKLETKFAVLLGLFLGHVFFPILESLLLYIRMTNKGG